MNDETLGSLSSSLSALADVKAPSSLLPGVLTAVGLADRYFTVDTVLGPVYIAFNEHGLSAVRRALDDADFETGFRHSFGRPAYRSGDPPDALVAAVRATLDGTSKPTLRFDLRGLTEFERAVLHKALEIPRGEVRPYGWIAREIGRPKAVRAVGSALAGNPIPLVIPCHRVVRTDGHIGNYGLGGPDAKRAVLRFENVEPDQLEALAHRGVRYVGSDTTRVFCFPTCRNARRITDHHRVQFHSESDADAAGYRPCRVCRPA